MPPFRTGRAYEGYGYTLSGRAVTIGHILVVMLLILFEHTRAFSGSLLSNSVDDWDERIICHGIPGLTKEQRDLCHKHPDETAMALTGLRAALTECQHQFMWNRWNCSAITGNRGTIFQRGYKETAFAHAISAAGVAHSVSRACSMGRLISCGCDQHGNENIAIATKDSQWKWGGCSHNVEYGMEFSKQFLDAREKAGDIQSTVNLHNNQAGRLVLANNMQVRCKCHGMSGSCELKTCWKTAPDFRIIGKTLKDRFKSAVLVMQSNLGNVTPTNKIKGFATRRQKIRQRKRHKLRKQRDDVFSRRKKKNLLKNLQNGDLGQQLYYYQKSPNFCERDPKIDIIGTSGRLCNKTSNGPDGCGNLCCGRGYNLLRERRVNRCRCKFHWCCYVKCDECHLDEWITVCK